MEKIEVEKNDCIGCGACVAWADEVFEFDDDGLSQVKDDAPNCSDMDKDLKEAVIGASENCPTDAIKIS